MVAKMQKKLVEMASRCRKADRWKKWERFRNEIEEKLVEPSKTIPEIR